MQPHANLKLSLTKSKLKFKEMLEKKNIIDVISPGTPCTKAEIKAIKDFLINHNLSPNIFLEEQTSINHKNDHEFSEISSKYRFQQFQMAWENPHSQVIWCSRGGYGSAEIIEFLSSMPKPKIEKTFIGFSDISSLNIFINQQWKLPTICAPMLVQCAFDMVYSSSISTILDLVSKKITQLDYQLINLKNHEFKEIYGEIVGGCVSVIAGNFATKNQIDWNQKILFLEDEGEDGERLDRYFQQITTIIKETHFKPLAIILGNFMQGNNHGTPKANNIKIAIEKFIKKTVDIPLFQEKTFCLGHSSNMMPIATGVKAFIDSNNILKQTITDL